jgi:hypothetical protein
LPLVINVGIWTGGYEFSPASWIPRLPETRPAHDEQAVVVGTTETSGRAQRRIERPRTLAPDPMKIQ